MSDTMEARGSCVCGSTQITAKTVSRNVGACHCGMCRKWAGGPFMAVDCGTEVSFAGEDTISIFDSSEWAERGFCNKCGTHLFYRLKHNQQYYMPVGIFEDDSKFLFDHQVFIDEKPKYYKFANKTNDMTGEEVFALFASSSE
ncbi:MAG: GFA family protein [Alphaproteobacteria bacterium]|nr:GFA family protein [Alphaproteobacteria bacterium]